MNSCYFRVQSGFPEQKGTNEGLPAFYALARTRDFALAIQMQGSGRSTNNIVAKLGAHTLAGYFIRWLNALPEPERYIFLMRCRGIPAEITPFDFLIFDEDHRNYLSLVTRCAIEPKRLICIHPGAQLPSRRCPPSDAQLRRYAVSQEDNICHADQC